MNSIVAGAAVAVLQFYDMHLPQSSKTRRPAARTVRRMKSNRAIQWVAVTLAIVGVVAALAVLAAQLLAERKRHRAVAVQVAPVVYTQDAQAQVRGKYLYETRGCVECHGANGAGRVFVDHPNGLHLKGANLTRGNGGAVTRYTEVDWVRSIRHGVDPAGRPLFAMPSEDFNRLTDSDLAALVAHVRALPPVDGQGGEIRLPLIVKGLYAVGVLRDAAEKIDHGLPPSRPVEAAVSVAHGRYVAQACIGCHGASLAGGRIPGTPPDWPPSARLAAGEGSVMPAYRTVEDFRMLMRTGRRPDGSAVDKTMPISVLKNMNDTDLDALYAFLKAGAVVVASP